MVSTEGLTKFKALYRLQYGIELSDEEALEKASKLLNLYRAVYTDTNKLNIRIKQNGKKTQHSKSS